MGRTAVSDGFGRAAVGGALPASLPVDDPAGRVSDDTSGVFAMAGGFKKVSRSEGGRHFARGWISRGVSNAGATVEPEERFSEGPGRPGTGGRAVPGVPGEAVRGPRG